MFALRHFVVTDVRRQFQSKNQNQAAFVICLMLLNNDMKLSVSKSRMCCMWNKLWFWAKWKATHQQVCVFKVLFPEGPDLPLSSDVPDIELHAVGGNTLDVEALRWATKVKGHTVWYLHIPSDKILTNTSLEPLQCYLGDSQLTCKFTSARVCACVCVCQCVFHAAPCLH